MQINRTNIEEHLFEYFEGLMNPQQADALMAFIHQHPEYESDLAQWHKTYHHKTHELEDYGIASSLKKPLPKSFVFKPIYFLGFLALGVLNGWFLNHYNKVPVTKEIGEKRVTTETLRSNAKIENRVVTPQKSRYKPRPIIPKSTEVLEKETVPEPVPKATHTVIYSAEVVDSVPEAVTSEQRPMIKDTLTLPKKAPVPPAPKAKKKRGRKGVFSTTDKILPPNDNF